MPRPKKKCRPKPRPTPPDRLTLTLTPEQTRQLTTLLEEHAAKYAGSEGIGILIGWPIEL
jgi:hypothetical protein